MNTNSYLLIKYGANQNNSIIQIEENSRALEYLGHGIGGSVSSLDSVSLQTNAAVQVSDMKAEKWKQGARKTLLTWVTNALPK